MLPHPLWIRCAVVDVQECCAALIPHPIILVVAPGLAVIHFVVIQRSVVSQVDLVVVQRAIAVTGRMRVVLRKFNFAVNLAHNSPVVIMGPHAARKEMEQVVVLLGLIVILADLDASLIKL